MPSPRKLSVSAAAQVHYTLAVLDAAGREVRTLPRKRNLILDQGLDGIAARTWIESFNYAVIGTGTAPTKRDSGAITFTRTADTVTASAGFFEAADVGRLLKFDTGAEMYVTAFASATSVTVSVSGTLAASEATVWYVNQTALDTESKRSNSYFGGASGNGSTFSGGTWTHKRTIVFSAEVGLVTYREIGWSHTNIAGGNLFGRDLLAGVGVTLTAGQQLKVTVELSVSYGPASPVAYTNVITGFTSDGAACVECGNLDALRIVSGSGAGTGGGAMDPSSTGSDTGVFVAPSDESLRPMANAVYNLTGTTVGIVGTKSSYVAGSFERTLTATFSISAANFDIGSMGFGLINGVGGLTRSVFRVLLDTPETKDSDHTLTLTFRISWGRVLTN